MFNSSHSNLFVLARLSLCFSLLFFAGCFAQAQVVVYPGPPNLIPSPHYKVSLSQGDHTFEPFVYQTSAQRQTNPHRDTSWVSFSFTNRITVSITVPGGEVSSCRVLPSSRRIVPFWKGNRAEFVIDRPGQFSVEINDRPAHPLLVFANPLEIDPPKPGDPDVVYFGPGVHDLNKPLRITSGQTVYLAGGAYVRGRIVGSNAANARIMGRGILSGETLSGTKQPLIDIQSWDTHGFLLEGITLINAPHYNIDLPGRNNTVRNVKLISWLFNTDGISIGQDGVVEDCFLKVNDDALKLYFSGMTVRRCVIWQMENGAPFQLSWNMPDSQSGFYVRDCDVIRVEHKWDNDNEAVFCSIHGGAAHMRNYLFENIRVENAHWRLLNLLIKPNEFAPPDRLGQLSDITFRNITVHGRLKKSSSIKGWNENHRISDVTFENLRINGRFIRNARQGHIKVDPDTTRNIRFLPNAM